MINQQAIQAAYWHRVVSGSAANGAPSLSTDGIYTPINRKGKTTVLRIYGLTNAQTVVVRLWGYVPGSVDSDGAAVASSSGWSCLEETKTVTATSTVTDVSERYDDLTVFNRLYVEIISITGGSFKVDLGFTEE